MPTAALRMLARICTALILLAGGGCASTARELGGAATNGALSEGIAQLRQPQNQKALEEISNSKPVQGFAFAMGQGLGSGFANETIGMVAGALSDSRTGPASSRPSRGSQLLRGFMQEQLQPAITEIVRSAVREGMHEALGQGSRADVRAAAVIVGDGTMEGVTRAFERDTVPMIRRVVGGQLEPAVRDLVHDQLRPEFRQWLQEDLSPMLRETAAQSAADALKIPTTPAVAPAVIENARNLSRGTTLGFDDQAASMGLLEKNGSLTTAEKWLLAGLIIVIALIGLAAGTLVVVLILWVVRFRRPQAGREGS